MTKQTDKELLRIFNEIAREEDLCPSCEQRQRIGIKSKCDKHQK